MANVNFNELIAFTRTTGGGRFNAQGVYEWLPANEPRIDYDPVTGECMGLLVEEQRTNMFTNSGVTQAGAGTNVTPDAAIAPDGHMSMDLVTEQTTSGEHYASDRLITLTALVTYTFSVFVKDGPNANRDYLHRVAGVINRALLFNPRSKEITANDYDSAGFVELPNGVFRVWGAYKPTSAGDVFHRHQLALNGSNVYTGDGTSGLYIWGSQLERGAFPTSYIPTTTTQATRAADVARVNELNPWYNAEAGTFVIKHDAPAGRRLLSSGANVIAVSQGPGKLVVAYDAQGSYVSHNDSPYVSGPALSIESTLDLFKSVASYMGARGQSLQYFPRKLTVSEAR